uniref:2-oxoacid:ferredoxin oxidoreductase subunit beta n=1 Tax=candidate division WOR-3 bacterium TaxID=2052148 RepID=A0A7C6EB64_UNCW3
MGRLIDYESKDPIAWCPGCGNFGILEAVKLALADLNLEPYQVLIVSGIGQAAKLPHYLRCNTFNGLHGRTLPVTTAAKITNHKLTVIAVSGDGDAYGEGGNHFLHALRRNIDITYLVHNNQVYGLTKGQASPTSDLGFVTKTTPLGTISAPINPLALAIMMDAGFVARGFAGEIKHLTWLIKEGIQHKGFSLIDILQPCVSFNKVNTFKWYKYRIYKVNEDPKYDPTNQNLALKKSMEWGDRIPIGIIYRSNRKSYNEQLPVIKEMPLVEQKISTDKFKKLLEEFY